VIHFGGIVSATMSVPPCPWLAQLVWTYFYRPYLELTYLVNAYHFYSPEPGPATQLWFYVKYDDGSNEWFKTPRPGEPPLKLEYFRRLSLAEYANQRMPAAPVPREKFEERILAGRKDGVSEHMTLPDIVQYQEPSLSSKIVLESYARRMFHHPPTPTKAVAGVRIYRATQALMTPKEFAMGRDPEDPNQFGIYYMGEYDADGKIKDPEDPYLYWLIPSVRYNVKPGYKGPFGIGPDGPIGMERDPAEFPFLEKHVTLPTRRH